MGFGLKKEHREHATRFNAIFIPFAREAALLIMGDLKTTCAQVILQPPPTEGSILASENPNAAGQVARLRFQAFLAEEILHPGDVIQAVLEV